MNARETALSVVRDVFPSTRAPARGAQEALEYRLERANLDARDRAFATHLAFGAIKMRRTLDWYLRAYVGARPKPLPPVISEVLRLAVYELRFSNAAPHATVSEWVGIAARHGHRGTAGLVNAVLRAFLRDDPQAPQRGDFTYADEYLGTAFSFPTWLVRTFRETFGDERLEAILEACNAPAQAAVTVNRLKTNREEVCAWFAERGASAAPSDLASDSVLVSDGACAGRAGRNVDGAWWIQSETSAIVVDVLNPQAGETIADVCSGRGSKALQAGARLGGDGRVACVDRDARKASVLQRRAAAAGIPLEIQVGDATQETGAERFDRILVDAPCSGIGVVGRHPEARWRKRPDDGERLAPLQRALLQAQSAKLFEGGTIVYAVCSTDRRETGDVAEWFARTHNVQRGLIPARFERFQTAEGDVLVPPGIGGRDGFFIARFERRL